MRRYVRPAEVLLTRHQERFFATQLDSGDVFDLNPTGHLILERAAEIVTLEDLVACVVSACEGVADERVREDLELALTNFVRQRLILAV